MEINDIYNTLYNLYNEDNSDEKITSYVCLKYNIIIDILKNTINLDKNNNNKYNFFDKENIDDMYIYYNSLNDDLEYDKHMMFAKSFRIIILDIINRNSDKSLSVKDFPLKAKEEMNTNENKMYNVIVTNDSYNIDKFSCFILVYYIEAYFGKQLYMGMDFEFNNRQIALFQINFESKKGTNDYSYIFLINPNEYEDKILQFFIRYILGNKYILKILHGSDSLDIPYIYNILLDGNTENIIRFTKSIVDTRFLCEYIKIVENEAITENKCSIYDALKYFNSINDNVFDFLEKNHENMGQPEDISWNIHNISDYQTLYGLYDVLFLKQFIKDIMKRQNNNAICKYIIPELTRFLYLEKRNVTTVLKNIKISVDTINNYMIKKINKKTNFITVITLNTIYNDIVDHIVINEPKLSIKQLMSVNYFRGQVGLLCKLLIYHYISIKYNIYKNKTEKCENECKIQIDELLEHLQNIKFLHLHKLILDLKEQIIQLVDERLKKL
jgi:hypothetical protein